MGRRDIILVLGLAAGLWWWGAEPARADQDANLARGFSPGKVYDYSGLDSVNLYNGALGLTIPIGRSYPVGDQFSYGLTLTYSSNVWDPEIVDVTPTQVTVVRMRPRRSSNAGLGWIISLGGVLYGRHHPSTVVGHEFEYESADGAVHVFYGSLHHPSENTGNDNCYFTRDNSYLRLCGSGGTRTIEFPDGTQRTFSRILENADPDENPLRPWDRDRYRLTRIEDRHGNWVEVSYVTDTLEYSSDTWMIEDSLGRTHTVSFDSVVVDGGPIVDGEPMWVVDQVDLEGFDGGRSIYDFFYQGQPQGQDPPTVQIDRSCKDSSTASDTVYVPLLEKVLLPPDESGFAMSYQMPEYNDECIGSKDVPGTISRLDLPTGGSLEWTYRSYNFEDVHPEDHSKDIVEQATGVRKKRVLNDQGECYGGGPCEWTYVPLHLGNGNRKTTVTTPAGDAHVSYFREKRPRANNPDFGGWDMGLPFTTAVTHDGLFLSQEIYDGPNLLRSIYVAYEHDLLPPASFDEWSQIWQRSNRRLRAQKTLYHDDPPGGPPNFTKVVHDDFDGLGHYRERVSSGNLGGSGTHTEITDYNPDHGTYIIDQVSNAPVPIEHDYVPWPDSTEWILGTYKSRTLQEPGSTIKSQYCFEETTGRLRRQRMQASASSLEEHDVIVERIREPTTLQPGGIPAILYEERAYGGDLENQGVDTGSDLCTLDLPATPGYWTRHTQIHGTLARTEPLDPASGSSILRTLDLTIDPSTGLEKTSTDPAGLATDFEYDDLGRLTWLKPSVGGDGDAWTEIEYCAEGNQLEVCSGVAGRPAHVTVRRRTNGGETNPVLEESRTVYDSLGRIAREDRKIPGHDWTYAATKYNAMGWVTEVTERGSSSSFLPHKTVYKFHDPFGRPTRIELPDKPSDSEHYVKLTYLGDRFVEREVSIATGIDGTETRHTSRELYDHLGRLYRVRQPSGPGGAIRPTHYAYDAAGRLVSVKMDDGPTFSQERTFTYDGRGFLLNETHPENGTTRYRRYDARGNAGRKTNGPFFGQFDIGFTFDNAGRLTEVCEWEQGGCGRPLKEFFYGNGTSSNDRSKGKIKTAVRHNHVNLPGTSNPVTVTVEETYTYGGKGGRASLRLTELSTYQKFFQGWTYNDLGQVTSLSYPTCQHTQTLAGGEAPLCTTEPNSRSVGFDYELGSLTAIPGFASEISYHPSGMLAEIHHANGAVYGQGLDDHWMKRPGSLWVMHPANPLSLVPNVAGVAGTPVELFYSYDGAGNVKSWFDWRYRYDGVSRVLEGSIVEGDGQSYEYDVFGNIRSITTERDGTPTTSTFVVDPNTNRLSGAAYDYVGNLLSRGPFTYSYDPLSMMQTMEGGGNDRTFIYTADDERIWSADFVTQGAPWEDTFTLRDLDGKVLRVFETESGQADLAWAQDYIYRDGQLLATARTDGAGGETHHHFHLNHLGTPLLITEPDGSTEALHSYFPFGEELNPDSDTERMKFTGHERDLNQPGQVDDLDYMHARYYSPLMGRFLSVDPHTRYRPQRSPQSWNRYSYALGNPLRWIDPDGLKPRTFQVKNYQFHVDSGHGGLHVDVSVKRGGRWVKLGRVNMDLEPIKHKGKVPRIPKTALKHLRRALRAGGWLGVLLEIITAPDVNADEPSRDSFANELFGKDYDELTPEEKRQAATAMLNYVWGNEMDEQEARDEDEDEEEEDDEDQSAWKSPPDEVGSGP